MNQPDVSLSARGVSKAFAGQFALRDVELTMRPGRVLALLGANGSGKSTLIKILAGYHVPERGAAVAVHGEPLAFGSPTASHAAGLRFIHQDLGLVDSLSVAENFGLAATHRNLSWISTRREARELRRVLASYQLDVDPGRLVATLRPYERSMLAIIRAVEDGLDRRGLLILDEPTASLPAHEVENLMALIRDLKSRGISILYVSHRLPEIFAIADDVCVLRDGQVVASRDVAGLEHDDLVELILGRRLENLAQTRGARDMSPLIEVKGMAGGTVDQVDLTVGAGEIVGVTGVVGSGFESVLGLIFGAQPRSAGSVTLNSSVIAADDPNAAVRCGMAYAPPDRRALGAIVDWTVRENLTLPALKSNGPFGWMTQRAEKRDADEWVKRLDVKPADSSAAFLTLSGGNQQKVVIARWLRCGAKAFLLDEPTAGVDAGAKQAIHHELWKAAEAGAAVLVASSDMDELCEICDRILVMSTGRIATSLQAPVDPDQLFAVTLGVADRV